MSTESTAPTASAECAPSAESSLPSAIYECIIAESKPCEFPEPWKFVSPNDACRQLPDDVSALVERLCREFDLESLLASHALIEDEDGKPALNGKL